MNNKAGWVLVGGRSSRMGRDKALLDIGRQPLAAQVAGEVSRVCGQVSLVGDPQQYAGLGMPVIPDRFPGQGPLAGIEAALGATTVEWNLIVACDMPALDVSILAALFEAGGDCAVPTYADGRIEPLCAVFHKSCHAEILSSLEAGVRRVTESISRLAAMAGKEIRYVPVTSSDPFVNLNTPADLERYRLERYRNG